MRGLSTAIQTGGGEVVIKTTRFGQVKVEEKEMLHFSEGILGFADLKKFVLLDDPHDDIFAWLQSCDEPAVAFPVLEPELFSANSKLVLAKSDLEALKLKDSAESVQFCIITIPQDPALMTANLKAPIVINVATRSARQCVLQDNNLAIREPIFSVLQQRVVQNSGKSLKSLGKSNIAVRVPAKDSEIGI